MTRAYGDRVSDNKQQMANVIAMMMDMTETERAIVIAYSEGLSAKVKLLELMDKNRAG